MGLVVQMRYDSKKGSDQRANKQRINYLYRALRKCKSHIGVVIAVILVLSIAATISVFAVGTDESGSWLESQYQMPNALESEQVAVCGDTTVRLLYVIPSSSQTLVELEIEDPGIGTGANEETLLPLRPGINLNLLGFSSNDLLSPPQVRVAQGTQRIVLDLPPLSDFKATATIELKDLRKRHASTGELTTIAGPWQLSFTPNVPAEQLISRNFNVNRQVEVGGVQVFLEGGQVSATETLVYYQVRYTSDVMRESLGQTTLEYADQVLRGNGKYDVGDNLVLSFPPLPDDVIQFTVTFPRMMSLDGPAALFSIPVGDYLDKPYAEDGDIPMDQVVKVGTAEFRFTSLVLAYDCFELSYQPADVTQSSGLLLAGPGSLSEIMEATDDKGNIYTAISAGAHFDNKSFELKEQRITFQGNLDPEASELSIRASATGVIGEPFVFNVEIVE